MQSDLPIQCSCGSLRAIARRVSKGRGNRLVCYCDDCQSFAYFLGRADEILDAHGGTDIFQMSPAGLQFKEGAGHLACVRLTSKGLLRWYADCCKTPIGNTLATQRVPFVGLIHSCIDRTIDGRSSDEILGPIRARVYGRFAKGDLTGSSSNDGMAVPMFVRLAAMLLVARLRGDHKKSLFFDPQTGEPSATPRVLTGGELRKIENERDER